MPRIQVLRNQRDFREATEGVKGFQVLTNVSFDGDVPEAIRFNLALPNSRLRRSLESFLFPRREKQFEIHNRSVLLSASQLNGFQDNFAVVHEVLGDRRLASIPIDDPIHELILPKIQARSYEILWMDSFLENVPMDSALYHSYLLHPAALQLLDADQPTELGATLLHDFEEAVDLYSQVPELREYFVQEDVEVENIGPRGQQFRQWLQQNHAVSDGGTVTLDYVAYELHPLRMSGGTFHWNQELNDLRRVSVDLLLRFEGNPVWCELKMRGDSWTSTALQQILFYGSMLCSGNQQRRCRRTFSDQFERFRPWLGIIVEEREENGFVEDFEQTLSFVQHPATQTILRDLFGGVVFGALKFIDDQWTLSRTEVIRL